MLNIPDEAEQKAIDTICKGLVNKIYEFIGRTIAIQIGNKVVLTTISGLELFPRTGAAIMVVTPVATLLASREDGYWNRVSDERRFIETVQVQVF
jgi:predicted thioredoxin/glutaredoxin